MKSQAVRPQVIVSLLLWGAIECWQLVRARVLLQRLGAGHDSASTRLRGPLDAGATRT
jgi:hypothetical protein